MTCSSACDCNLACAPWIDCGFEVFDLDCLANDQDSYHVKAHTVERNLRTPRIVLTGRDHLLVLFVTDVALWWTELDVRSGLHLDHNELFTIPGNQIGFGFPARRTEVSGHHKHALLLEPAVSDILATGAGYFVSGPTPQPPPMAG